MPTEQYAEYIKQTDDSWVKQHPETGIEQITDIFPTMRFSLGETKYLSPTTNIPLTRFEVIDGNQNIAELSGGSVKINIAGLYLITTSVWIEEIPNQTTLIQLLTEPASVIESIGISRWSDKVAATYTAIQKLQIGQKIYLHTDNEYAVANPSYKSTFPANKISITLMLLKSR